MTNKEVINWMEANNSYGYSLEKAAEECQELGLILIQKVLHGCNDITDQNIIDEIGDVIIRLKLLKRMFPKGLIKQRVDYKLSKFAKWIEEGKYSQI